MVVGGGFLIRLSHIYYEFDFLRGLESFMQGLHVLGVLIIYGTTFKKNESGRDFQRGQIWNDRSQKQKKNYGSHESSKRG